MIRPRGVVSELYPNFVGYIAGELSFTGTHPPFYRVSHPMFRLPGFACEHSRVLLIVLLWRISFARRSSHASRGEALLIMLPLSVSFTRRGVKD